MAELLNLGDSATLQEIVVLCEAWVRQQASGSCASIDRCW